jgi:hypothetical protein
VTVAAFATDIWNTGETYTTPRPHARAGSLQFRNAHQVETTSRDGQSWTVLWTRATWEAEIGHLSVLSVLCLPSDQTREVR